jgi:hypothetical protein
MNYTPKFNDFVTGIASNGVTFHIREQYCLNRVSAVELQTILKDLSPVIVYGTPVPNFGNRYVYSEQVPFFKFPDGKVRNAGVLANYWSWGGSKAEQYCRIDIAEDYTGEELL